jgi:hypothetical protein
MPARCRWLLWAGAHLRMASGPKSHPVDDLRDAGRQCGARWCPRGHLKTCQHSARTLKLWRRVSSSIGPSLFRAPPCQTYDRYRSRDGLAVRAGTTQRPFGRGKRLTQSFRATRLVPCRHNPRGKSGGPPPLAPSFKFKGDVHNQRSGGPQRAGQKS